MRPDELERYLHSHIPLSAAMAVSVIGTDDESVTLRAPLGPNTNHHHTVFGGSASAVAMLAAWSLLHIRLERAGVAATLVIRRNTMDYEAPITGSFEARAGLVGPGDWEAFSTALERRGKARIMASTALLQEGRVVARFSGEFAALRPPAGEEASPRSRAATPGT